MKKPSLIVIGIFIVLLMLTKPKFQDYSNWFQEKQIQNGSLTRQASAFIFRDFYVKNTSKCEDYIIVLKCNSADGPYKLTALGMFNNFFVLSESR